MSTLVYALALFGCSDDATLCERPSDKAQDYASQAKCEMASEQAFDSELAGRADYPTVIARCMTRPELAKLGGRPVDLSRPAIRLASRD
jgi:hypothetical protein